MSMDVHFFTIGQTFMKIEKAIATLLMSSLLMTDVVSIADDHSYWKICSRIAMDRWYLTLF